MVPTDFISKLQPRFILVRIQCVSYLTWSSQVKPEWSVKLNKSLESLLSLFSTGPLISRKGGTSTLIGITSFGRDCSDYVGQNNFDYQDYWEGEAPPMSVPSSDSRTRFGFYTNVSSYVDWIIQNSDYTGCKKRKLLFHRCWEPIIYQDLAKIEIWCCASGNKADYPNMSSTYWITTSHGQDSPRG